MGRHEAFMGQKRNACRVLMGKAGRKNTLEFRNVVESTILKLILKECVGVASTDLIWLRMTIDRLS